MSNWLDRILAWFGYIRADSPRPYARVNNGGDAIARGQRWESFYAEEGGLGDMIARIRHGYFEAAAALGVSETDKLYEYALADRIAREIDREVRSVIETGKMREAERDFATRSAALR